MEAKLTDCYNHRNELDWFVGFTRPSTNFCQIVNSFPAFVEETYFRQTAAQDIVQSIVNSFHPSVFERSSVLVVRIKGSPSSLKRAVMEKFSRSTPAAPLGIQLPKCPNCREDRFLVGKFHSGKLNIRCKGCNTTAERIEVPSDLLALNIWTKRGFSLLPYPLPNPLPHFLKINWPQKTSAGMTQPSEPQNKQHRQRGIVDSLRSGGSVYGMVRTLRCFIYISTLMLASQFCHFCEDTGTMVKCSYSGCNFVSCSKVKENQPGCTLVGSEDKLKWLCPTHNAPQPPHERMKVSLFL